MFSHDRQRKIQRLGHENSLIIGQTGVGKSTLINAVFRKPLAKAQTNKPDQSHPTVRGPRRSGHALRHQGRRARGLEVARDSRLQAHNREVAKAAPEHHIHLLWYCMDAGQTRVQDYDVDIVRALAEEVPVVLVFTQTIDDERADALQASVSEAGLPIENGGKAVRTLAEPRRIRDQTLPPRGLVELVEVTNELLPEGVRRAFIAPKG